MKLRDCTLLIKAFLRPHCLARLLLSIHRHYPGTDVIVVDDSGNDDAARVCAPYGYVTLISMGEKDVGCSRGRNVGLSSVTTKYFVTFDDDFVVCGSTNLEMMMRRLEDTGADIVCGTVIDPGTQAVRQSAMGFLEHCGKSLLVRLALEPGTEGWVKASTCFFIAHTDLRNKVMWPEALKTFEHAPFFWLAHKAGCKVWASNISAVVHFKDRCPEYERYRTRADREIGRSVREACGQFREREKFVWQTHELLEEYGSLVGVERFGWHRSIPPACPMQEQFIKLLHRALS